jgi:Zn-dependent protease
MDSFALYRGLLDFVAFVAFVVLHEYAHAWMAVRCGDDTPRLQGRLTLDPLAHIDLVGTIILPLAVTLITAAGGGAMLFGWGRPVQVNLSNFQRRRFDDILVSGAGPAMNVLIAVVLMFVIKGMILLGMEEHTTAVLHMARLSLFLCFFNLLPIPPLDGGHILRNLVGISDEAYMRISQYSFLFFVMMLQIPAVGRLVNGVTDLSLAALAWPFGWTLTRF